MFLTFNPFRQRHSDTSAALQQMTFENIAAKGEIAHDDQFLLLPQCFQLYLIITLSFADIHLLFNSSCGSKSINIKLLNK